MFTSRAEYRLSLRSDNADLRLTRKGAEAGIVGDERLQMMLDRDASIGASISMLQGIKMPTRDWSRFAADASPITFQRQNDPRHKTAFEVLEMPNVELSHVEFALERLHAEKAEKAAAASTDEETLTGDGGGGDGATTATEAPLVPASARHTVEASVKYDKYLDRQEKEMEHWRRNMDVLIPLDISYTSEELPSMSSEELEKLSAVRPRTFHEASQISGMTPHSLVYLYHLVTRRQRRVSQSESHDRGTGARVSPLPVS